MADKSQRDVVIDVKGVYKDFKFSSQRSNTIKSIFTGLLHEKDKDEKTQHALKDISFDIKKGEFFGIVGRNGSGKSTLLKILAGIYQPTKGNVAVKGKLVPFIELGVGFNPELTGKENVYMNGAMLGFSDKEIDVFYREVVEFAELEKFMDKKLKNYSSGMQVRLAFSMAIRAEADVLLVDEVLAVGDADFQRKCFDYFRKLKKNKKTVVFVSHDMNSVREYCDRALLIEKSEIVAQGKPTSVASEYSKMFLKELKHDDKTDTSRWGDKSATFTKVTAEPKNLKDDNSISITLNIKVNDDFENANIGFSIQSQSGQNILGTNSKIKGKDIKKLNKGDHLEVVWSIPNVFSNGTYFVSPAIVREDGTPADWWEEAVSFEVINSQNTPYQVSPKIDISVSYKEG